MLAECPSEHLLEIRDDIIQIEDLRTYDFLAGKGQQLARQRRSVFSGQRDLLEVTVGRLPT